MSSYVSAFFIILSMDFLSSAGDSGYDPFCFVSSSGPILFDIIESSIFEQSIVAASVEPSKLSKVSASNPPPRSVPKVDSLNCSS